MLIIKNIKNGTYNFLLLKPAATLLLFITICLKYEFVRSATFKKQAKTLNKKALAAIAEDV